MALLNKKKIQGPKTNKKNGKSAKEREEEIMDAINQVVDSDDTENRRQLQYLLISTAFFENSLGANNKAYGRDYTNSQWSIDDIFLNDILSKSGYAVDDQGKKTDKLRDNNYNKFLIKAGYDPGNEDSMKQFVKDLENDNALTGAYMARLKYSLNPNTPLPDLTKESMFEVWHSDYNSGGIEKESEEYNKIMNNFNNFWDEFYEEEVPSETEEGGGQGSAPQFMQEGQDIFSPGSWI